jgi:uncharacterized protein
LGRHEARHARRALRRLPGDGALRRFLYDTNIFVYAVGDAHPHREPCRAVIERAQAGRLLGEASPDLLQEFLHQRTRRTGDRAGASALARDVARLCRFDELSEADALRALDLFARYESLSASDAVFAAFALNRGIDTILSVDTDLDGIEGLTRVDPADPDGLEALTK